MVCSKITVRNTFGVTMSGRFSWIWKDFICLPKSLPIYFQISPDNLQKKKLINFLESKKDLNYWKDLWKWLPAFTGERNCILILQQETRWLIKSMEGWFQASLLYSWIYGFFPILEPEAAFALLKGGKQAHICTCTAPFVPAPCTNGDTGRHSPATSTARFRKWAAAEGLGTPGIDYGFVQESWASFRSTGSTGNITYYLFFKKQTIAVISFCYKILGRAEQM